MWLWSAGTQNAASREALRAAVSRQAPVSANMRHATSEGKTATGVGHFRLTWFSNRSIQRHMSTTPQLSAAQLHHAAEIQTTIEALQAKLVKVLNGTSAPVKAPAEKRTHSAAGRARTIAGSKAYWARIRAAAKPTTARAVAPVPPKKGRISPAGLRRIAAASKARWAKAKAAGKTKL